MSRTLLPRLASLIGTAVLAAGASGCGVFDDGSVTGSATAAAPAAPSLPSPPPQAANGALLVDGGPKALDVQLEETAIDPVRIRFHRPPAAGLLIDVDTGEVLWRHRPLTPLPIASLTKIMTAVLVAESTGPRDKVRVSERARAVDGSKLGILPRKERVRVETLLNVLMLISGNDAAVALAEHVAGTEEEFVALMNERAEEERLACTRFASSSGIVDEGNRSCAVDLAAMARLALDSPRVAKVVGTHNARFPFPTKGGRLHLFSHNPLIKDGFPGALGIKTGFTSAAGRCFVGAAEQDGRRLVVVLLDADDPGRKATQLLQRGFALSG